MTRRLGDAAKLLDSRSSRSRQRKVGASEIGVCRRRAGYSHHGVEPSNPENVTGLPAVVGTWIHKGALATMRTLWGTIIETRVENAALRGHVDGIDLPNHLRVSAGLQEHPEAPDVVEVDDLKTRRDARMVEYVRNRGPKRSELFQVHLYGGMLRSGEVKPIQRQARLAELGPLDVERVRLRYFPRTGEEDVEFVHEQPFDPEIEAEALEWVGQVAASRAPEDLPRDEDGPGLSVVCDRCPFRRACWGEEDTGYAPQAQLLVTDADLARVLAEYDDARTAEREAKHRKDVARAVLDATAPAIYTDGERAYKIGWGGGGVSDPKPDVEAMVELFRQAGLEVPYLDARPLPRTIQLTRWDPPEQECGKPVGDPPEVQVTDDPVQVARQDRPRGSWTIYGPTGDEIGTMTASAARGRLPEGWVDPRPTCVLKKAHSGSCAPEGFIRELDVDDVEAAGSDDGWEPPVVA